MSKCSFAPQYYKKSMDCANKARRKSIGLPSTEEILAKDGADTQYLTYQQAEGDDNKRHGERGDDFCHKVRTISIKPHTHLRQLGQKDVVEQINVERAHTDVL